MSTLKLSTLNGDFDAIKDQLRTYLASKDSWKGTLTTQTGETIMDFIAALASYDSFRLTRSYEDAFPTTAVSNESIYAIASMQGLRIMRKQPASMQVTITPPSTLSIPAYCQFTGGGTFFFNREVINLVASVPQTITLYQGRLIDITMNGLGNDFQLFLSQERQFQVSDTDVRVSINSVPIAKTSDGLWKLKGVGGFRDRTLPDGRLVVEFGNSVYGSRPSQTDTVNIVYALTSGASANNMSLMGKKFVMDINPSVVMVSIENPNAGVNEQDPTIYKNVAAATFGNFGSAVTKEQYQSTAASYPGVVDAIVFAQRDINPTALQWMNVMRVSLLTTTAWNQAQSAAYLQWLQTKTMYSGRFVLDPPVGISTSVSGIIYVYNWANPTQAQADAIAAVQALFQQCPGYMGRDIELNDIYETIKDSNKGIDYVDIFSPTSNLVVSNKAIDAPGYTLNLSASTLSGTCLYGVGVVTAFGEIVPKNWTTVVIPTANAYTVQLNWAPYPGALNYKVYGRGNNASQIGRIAQVATNSFLDTGGAPFGTVPAFSTSPIRYNVLAGVALQVKYTDRTYKG